MFVGLDHSFLHGNPRGWGIVSRGPHLHEEFLFVMTLLRSGCSRRGHRDLLGRLVGQIQCVGDLRHGILDKHQARCIGRSQIADCGQDRVTPGAALRIARGRSRAAFDNAIAVGQRLDRLIGNGGGIRRTQHRCAGRRFKCPKTSYSSARAPGVDTQFHGILRKYVG